MQVYFPHAYSWRQRFILSSFSPSQELICIILQQRRWKAVCLAYSTAAFTDMCNVAHHVHITYSQYAPYQVGIQQSVPTRTVYEYVFPDLFRQSFALLLQHSPSAVTQIRGHIAGTPPRYGTPVHINITISLHTLLLSCCLDERLMFISCHPSTFYKLHFSGFKKSKSRYGDHYSSIGQTKHPELLRYSIGGVPEMSFAEISDTCAA